MSQGRLNELAMLQYNRHISLTADQVASARVCSLSS